MRVKLIQAIKPGKTDMSEELDLNLARAPEMGPGALKPNMGRGGVPVPDNYYLDDDLKVPTKKGLGIGEKEAEKKDKTSATGWSDVI